MMDLEQEFGWPAVRRDIATGDWPSARRLAELVRSGAAIPDDMRSLIAGRMINDPAYPLPPAPRGRPKYGAFERMMADMRREEIAGRKRRWERVYRDRYGFSDPATRSIETVAVEYGVTPEAIEKAISASKMTA